MYLTHETPDSATPLEETLRALDDLIHQGKVRYIGASNMPAWLMTKALWISDKYHLVRFEWVQNSYSLLDRADEKEMFPLCEDQRLGYTPFSPLAGGWLTGKYKRDEPFPTGSRMTLRPEPYQKLLDEKIYHGLEALRAHAAERGTDIASLALAWVMSHPLVTAPILGPRKPEHLEPAKRAMEIKLTDEERDKIAAFLS
jgi:aryl-alcohol dehydrogenase-like predicted oxidoreductase